jgi:hypothetical protein
VWVDDGPQTGPQTAGRVCGEGLSTSRERSKQWARGIVSREAEAEWLRLVRVGKRHAYRGGGIGDG